MPVTTASTSTSTPSASHILALLLLLTPSFAFIPIQPLPSDFDTNLWIPIATFTPSPTTHYLEARNPNPNPDPDPQGAAVTAPAAAQPATVNPDQVSPITTYQVNEYKGGAPVAVNVVYTQTFAAVPDQWASASAGSIGLGTIQGVVGVVKTKRSVATQEVLLVGSAIQTAGKVMTTTTAVTAVGTETTGLPGGGGGGGGGVTAAAAAVVEVEQEVPLEYELGGGAVESVVEPALVEVNGAVGRRGGVFATAAVLAASLLVGAFML